MLLQTIIGFPIGYLRHIFENNQWQANILSSANVTASHNDVIVLHCRALSLEDMVELLSCVKQLLFPNKPDRFVPIIILYT